MADEVAGMSEIGVRGIVAPRLVERFQESSYRLTPQPKKRPQQGDALHELPSRRHAADPGQPGAPQHPLQDRLRLVVRRVTGHDVPSAVVERSLHENVVSQPTRTAFQTLVAVVIAHRDPPPDTRQPQARREIGDEPTIVGGIPAKIVLDMGDDQPPFQPNGHDPPQGDEQGDAIRATGDGREHRHRPEAGRWQRGCHRRDKLPLGDRAVGRSMSATGLRCRAHGSLFAHSARRRPGKRH